MENVEELTKLLISMINKHKKYGDDIGFTKKEMDHFINKYDLVNLEYSPSNAVDLYDEKYLTKDEFVLKIREFFDNIEIGDNNDMDIIEYVEWLERNNLIEICMDKMENYSEIKEENGNWYFYAKDGWEYFSNYFSIDTNYRNNVVETILSGEGREFFQYDCSGYEDFYYLKVEDNTIIYLKDVLKKMKDDYEIKQEEIDNVEDFEDIVSIAKEYNIDELLDAFMFAHCSAQEYADENEAYDSLINQIIEHFGLTLDGLKWVKVDVKSKYDDALKIKFINEDAAKDAIILLYKIDNRTWDEDDYHIKYDSPYNGWNGDANEYFDQEIRNRIYDDVDEKYLP